LGLIAGNYIKNNWLNKLLFMITAIHDYCKKKANLWNLMKFGKFAKHYKIEGRRIAIIVTIKEKEVTQHD
jgi:hypothetical protein